MTKPTARRIAAVLMMAALPLTMTACPSSDDADTEIEGPENENESPEVESPENESESPENEGGENENESDESG
jgi:hypothetical protein